MTVSFTEPLKIQQLTKHELYCLTGAWDWLIENNLPFGGCDDSRYIIAKEKNGDFCGIIETRDFKDFLWIQLVFVPESKRRLGYGQKLIQEVINYQQRTDGIRKRVGLGTRVSNEAMNALATKFGFAFDNIKNYWR